MDFFVYSRDAAGTTLRRDKELLEEHWSYMDAFAESMIAADPTLAAYRETATGVFTFSACRASTPRVTSSHASQTTARASTRTKSFGIWPLSQAAEACFGTPRWPAEHAVPQVSIEFDVGDAEAVGATAEEFERAGYELLHPARTEPWVRRSATLQSPEGAIIGIS